MVELRRALVVSVTLCFVLSGGSMLPLTGILGNELPPAPEPDDSVIVEEPSQRDYAAEAAQSGKPDRGSMDVSPTQRSFIRGDANDDGDVNITDVLYGLKSLFLGGTAPGCENAADANGDGQFNLNDPLFTADYLVSGGQAPPSPGAEVCGWDLSAGALSCEQYSSCATESEAVVLKALEDPIKGGKWVARGPTKTINGQVESIPGNDPVIGAIHTVVADPSDADTLYLGAVNGGVWKTTNATSGNPTWTPLTDTFPGISIGALELDPTDGSNQTLVAGIGRFSSFGRSGGALTGILRTTDGGASWTQLGATDLANANISGVGPRGNTILVSANSLAGSAPGMYRSTDGGASFQNISGLNGLGNGQVFDLVGDPGNQSRFYASVGSVGVYRTDDTGASWNNVTDAAIAAVLNAGTTNVEFAVHDNSGAGTNAVFVGIVNNGQVAGFFRSPDQGATWTAMDIPQTNEGGNPFGLQPRFKPGGQGAVHFSMLADPGDANAVYVGGDRQPRPGPDGIEGNNDDAWPNSLGANDFSGRLFRGDASVAPTGGVPSPQWEHMTHSDSVAAIPGGGTASGSSPHADSREMVLNANGDIVEGDDGGIYLRTSRTDNTGDWFSLIGSNLQVSEFHDIAWDTNSNTIIAGAQDTGTHQQPSSGDITWDSVNTADGGDVAVDNLTLAGVGQAVRYSSSQNLGGFRREIYDNTGAQVGPRVGLIPDGGLAGFAGQFVTPIAVNAVPPPGGQSARLVICGGTNANAGINVGAIYESPDAAFAPDNNSVTWVQVPTGAGFTAVNRVALAYGGYSEGVGNPEVFYVASGSQVYLRTTAGGTLNQTAGQPPGAGTIVDIVLDPSEWNSAYVIDTNQVFESRDTGANWTDITGNLATQAGNFRTIEYIEGEQDKIAVGTNAGVFIAIEPHFDCWFELGSSLPNVSVWDLDYDPADDLLLAGTLGRGAWSLDEVSELSVPHLTVPGDVRFDDTCVGDTSVETLHACNTGFENLFILDITSSDPQFTVPEPVGGYPVVVSPDFCFPFQVLFEPDSLGLQSAIITIESSDPCQESLEIDVTGEGTEPRISTVVANSGSFGDVCVGDLKDLDLTINNSGGCDLEITSLTSSDPVQFKPASAMSFPLVVHPGDSLHVPIRFEPTSFGAKAADITIDTNDPDTPSKVVSFSGNAPPGEIRVTGSTDFGDVCADELAEKTISICNVGACNLEVTSVAFDPPCPDFTLINNPYPATVSPDFCMDVVIRFTPTSAGPKICTLVIQSDDPVTPEVTLEVTGNTPIPSIDVPPDQAFPPTVIQPLGVCKSMVKFPISNTGQCNLEITDVSITDNGEEYALDGLPSFPIILQEGHVAGEGDLRITFGPNEVARERVGEVSVTYVSDPITGDTTTVTRRLCGEGVKTGARVIATAGGVPLDTVEKIMLLRINANRNRTAAELDTVDNTMDPQLQTVTPTPPCPEFSFLREYGTVSNPIQLLPGFYQVSVTARINGKRETKMVGFNVDTCDFNPNIKVEF